MEVDKTKGGGIDSTGPLNQSGGENPEGDEHQGVPPGPAKPLPSVPYRGGRQGQGGIPNPDDADDDHSAGSFRGTEKVDRDSDDEKNSSVESP